MGPARRRLPSQSRPAAADRGGRLRYRRSGAEALPVAPVAARHSIRRRGAAGVTADGRADLAARLPIPRIFVCTSPITRHVVGSAFRARLGIPQCAELHVAGPFVAIGGYFSWRSLRMRSLRALMAANSRWAHIVAAMPHPKPITNIVI